MTEEQQDNKGNNLGENTKEEPSEKIEGKRDWIRKNAKYLLIGAATLFLIIALGLGGLFFARLRGHRFAAGSRQLKIGRYDCPGRRDQDSKPGKRFGFQDGRRLGVRDQFQRRFSVRDQSSVGGNSITGKVAAADGQTFTIDQDGKTRTVQITDATRFPLDSAAKVNAGDTVIVFGEQNSKGVILATRIIVDAPANKSP